MKRTKLFIGLTLVLALALAVVAQVPGKYFGFTPDRFWSNAGVLRTDGAIEPYGGINFAGIVPAGTAGSLIGTGTTWVAFPTASSCGIKVLLSYTAATGEFASLRIRARSNSVAPVVSGNFAASAGQNDHGNLYAVQGYAQPLTYTQSSADNIVNAIYGCVQRSAGGTSVGRDWTAWFDTHMAVKASGGTYLLRLSHNGTVANDGAITVYHGGRMPVLFNFEDATGGGFLTDSDGSHSVASGAIAVKTPAGTKYIVLYD